MPDVTIRAAVVRVGSRKVAEIHNATLTVTSNDKAAFGAQGYLGHTQGATVTKMSAKAMQPVAGMSVDMASMVINKTRPKLEFFISGKGYQLDKVAIVEFSVDSETETGMAEGTYSFEGGPVAIIG